VNRDDFLIVARNARFTTDPKLTPLSDATARKKGSQAAEKKTSGGRLGYGGEVEMIGDLPGAERDGVDGDFVDAAIEGSLRVAGVAVMIRADEEIIHDVHRIGIGAGLGDGTVQVRGGGDLHGADLEMGIFDIRGNVSVLRQGDDTDGLRRFVRPSMLNSN
jgi:hypothetical protein